MTGYLLSVVVRVGESSSFIPRFGGSAHRLVLFLFEDRLHIQRRKEMHDARDGPGPSGLVAGAAPRAGVPVELLIEQGIIFPMGIVQENF